MKIKESENEIFIPKRRDVSIWTLIFLILVLSALLWMMKLSYEGWYFSRYSTQDRKWDRPQYLQMIMLGIIIIGLFYAIFKVICILNKYPGVHLSAIGINHTSWQNVKKINYQRNLIRISRNGDSPLEFFPSQFKEKDFDKISAAFKKAEEKWGTLRVENESRK